METEECMEKNLSKGIPIGNPELFAVRLESLHHNLSPQSLEGCLSYLGQRIQGLSAGADITNERELHNDGEPLNKH